jgi:hypothetical protein
MDCDLESATEAEQALQVAAGTQKPDVRVAMTSGRSESGDSESDSER